MDPVVDGKRRLAPVDGFDSRQRYRLIVRSRQWLALLRQRFVAEGKPLADDDSIWGIRGLGSSAEPGDVARNKHEYLGDLAHDT